MHIRAHTGALFPRDGLRIRGGREHHATGSSPTCNSCRTQSSCLPQRIVTAVQVLQPWRICLHLAMPLQVTSCDSVGHFLALTPALGALQPQDGNPKPRMFRLKDVMPRFSKPHFQSPVFKTLFSKPRIRAPPFSACTTARHAHSTSCSTPPKDAQGQRTPATLTHFRLSLLPVTAREH